MALAREISMSYRAKNIDTVTIFRRISDHSTKNVPRMTFGGILPGN